MILIGANHPYELAKKAEVPYTYIICMMAELKCREKSDEFYRRQLEVSYLPMEIIKLLWQRRTVPRVVDLFWDVYERVSATEKIGEDYYIYNYCGNLKNIWPEPVSEPIVMTWSALYNSWLYKTLVGWVNDEDIDVPDRAHLKRTLFDIPIAMQSNFI